jgi:hypothetical protein
MPDMLAHYEVAEAARARLPEGPLARVLAARHDVFKVGAQGPDFFFYAGVWPGRRGRGDLAFLVHQHRTDELFRALLAAAGAAPAEDGAVIAAFACGHAAHICLDAGAHPLIQYWTGDVSAGGDSPAAAAARRRHGVFEGSIDVALARRRSRDPAWIRRQRLLAMTPAHVEVVAGAWELVMREVHGVAFTAAEGRAAFRDMAFVYGSMSDPGSPLSRLLAAAAPLLDGGGTIRTQIYPRAPHAAAAALLAGSRPWYSPWVPEVRRSESFADILEAATAETLRCLAGIEDALFRDADPDAALAPVGDRNLITGLPCEDPRAPVAFAPDPAAIWGIA